MHKADIQYTLRCSLYYALIGLTQATGFAGGLDYGRVILAAM